MTQFTHGEDLERLVAATRRRLRAQWLATGAGVVLITSLGWLLLAALIDAVTPMSVPVRVIVFALWCVIAGGGLAAFVGYPLIRRVRMDQVAHRIERTVPGIHNRLITVLDLRRRNGDARAAAPFVQRLLDQTRDRLRAFNRRDAADPRPMRRTLAAAAALIVLFGGLTLLLNPRLPNAVHRLLRPTAAIAPITGVTLVPPGDLDVLQGDSVDVVVRTRGDVPDELTLEIAGEDGVWHKHPMKRVDAMATADAIDPGHQNAPDLVGEDGAAAAYSLTIHNVDQMYQYKVVGGGTWTGTHAIRMVSRPIVESVSASLRLPDYLGVSEPRAVDSQATQIAAPAESTLQLSAAASQGAERGVIRLFTPVVEEVGGQVEQETVWFDDQPSVDAELTGNWRWVQDRAFSGAAAHTFDWRRQAYGFTTKLSPMDIPPASTDARDAKVFFYVSIDPEEPPQRVSVVLAAGEQRYRLVWGDDEGDGGHEVKAADGSESGASERPRFGDARRVHVGELPAQLDGGWIRLTVPVERLVSDASEGMKFTGVTFEPPGEFGRVWFDRMGYVTMRPRATRTVKLEPAGDRELSRDAETGQWRGDVPIDRDFHFSLLFENATGHASVPTRAVSVVAVTDRPPAVRIDRPAKDVKVTEATQVPVVARVTDDLGVKSVVLRSGLSATELARVQTLAEYDTPTPSARVMAAIDLASLALQTGQAVYYTVEARDVKGQSAASELHSVTLVDPAQEQTEEAERRRSLAEMLEELKKLDDQQRDADAALRELLDGLPEGMKPMLTELPENLKNPDGSPMTREQMRRMIEELRKQLAGPQADMLAKLNEQLLAQQKQADKLAEQFDQAAHAAETSPTALPFESDALWQMSDALRQLANDRQPVSPDDAQLLEKMRQMQQKASGSGGKEELARLQQQLAQLLAAHKMLAENPAAFEQVMQSLIAQMQAGRSLQDLQALASHLASQQMKLGELADRTEQQQQRARGADGATLEHVSAEQVELDKQAMELLAQVRDLLRERAAQDASGPGKVWDARQPGKPEVEPAAPKPDELKGKTPDEIAAELEKQLAAAREGQEQWWDKQVERDADAAGSEGDPAMTPRQMLQAHQEQLYQALRANSESEGQVRREAGEMQSRLSELLRAASPDMSRPADPEATQAMQEAMRSPEMQELLRMAERAQRQRASSMMTQQMPGDGNAPPGAPQGQGQSRDPRHTGDSPIAGQIQSMDLSDVALPADLREKLYRLPPELRRPLLDAMQQRGPEGYQPLIDAYFEELAEQGE